MIPAFIFIASPVGQFACQSSKLENPSDSSNPEEMYYVTFVECDSVGRNFASIAIRSVYNSISGWVLEDKTSSSQEKRIQGRFDLEIISKIDLYTGTMAIAQ